MLSRKNRLVIACVVATVFAFGARGATITVTNVGAASKNTIEIRGVGASDFNPRFWKADTLHLLPDARDPLLDPKPGKFRNIYAPSIVQTSAGWRIFFGGWDGTATGNDRVYSVDTRDFLAFTDRHTVIEHGPFQHVNNVSAVRSADGGFDLMCTAYPTANGTNKPAFFHLPTPNATTVARATDLITMSGYDKFPAADINGMNPILREGDRYRLYFASFNNFGAVYRASSSDGRHFTFEQKVLDHATNPNDVKKFTLAGETYYVMALHMNGPELDYALSRDGLHFDPMKKLLTHEGDQDRYIVAVGFVTSDQKKLLGVLYGAGAVGSLDANRIFARWLQKRVVIDGKIEPAEAIGSDRAVIKTNDSLKGSLELFDDDGRTRIAVANRVDLRPGHAYQLEMKK